MHSDRYHDCPVRKSLDVLGGKWKLLIIHTFEGETRRYGELRRLLPEISEKMLTQELKELVRDNIIEKKAYNEVPPRVEYKLTKKGEEALPIVASLYTFGTTLKI